MTPTNKPPDKPNAPIIDKPGQPGRIVETKRAEPYISTYVNSAQVQLNFFDFRINFGEIAEVTEEKLTIINKVTISMTPEHAKMLSKILSANIERYENEMGKIRDLKVEEV